MNFAAYIERESRTHPKKAALIHGDQTRTYQTLDRNANAFANWLTDVVDEDEIVALYLPNHIELVNSFYGALKAAVTPLPINYRFTDDEVEYVLESAGVSVLVTLPEHTDLATDLYERVDSLEHVVTTAATETTDVHQSLSTIYDEFSQTFETRPRKNESRAGMMFTSGTTGDPKGVQHSHENLIFNCDGYIDWFDLAASDVALNVTPLYHVGGLNITCLPTLKSGGTVVLLDEWDPKMALELMTEHDVTWSFTIATMLIDLVNLETDDEYDLSSVRFVGYGGSPLPTNVAEEFEERYGIEIYGGYGLTETTPLATFNPMDERRKHGSMGVPHSNEVDVRVVDPESGEEVAQGDPGELQIRGSTVTPGYYDEPEATEYAFTDDGWFRTGDIVRRDEDGIIWFVDRTDNMIVTGGENVYPKEVEDVLYKHPAVRNVAVVGVEDERFVTRIKAVVVADEDLSTEDLREFCSEEGLADFKQPRETEFRDELPKTASGKIDKKALEDS